MRERDNDAGIPNFKDTAVDAWIEIKDEKMNLKKHLI